MSEETPGSCRCGRVRLTVRGRPLLTMACHCTGCQKMTASAFSLSSLYPRDAVQISGETVIGGVHGETPQHGNLRHHCCAHCLSWVYTSADFIEPLINIRSTMLDAPMTEPPFIECWLNERLPWAQTGARHGYPGFPDPTGFPALMAEFAASAG